MDVFLKANYLGTEWDLPSTGLRFSVIEGLIIKNDQMEKKKIICDDLSLIRLIRIEQMPSVNNLMHCTDQMNQLFNHFTASLSM